MSPIWLLPSAVTMVAALVAWRYLRAVADEADALRRDLRTLPVLTERARALRAQAERTAAATDATSDVFGARPPQ